MSLYEIYRDYHSILQKSYEYVPDISHKLQI